MTKNRKPFLTGTIRTSRDGLIALFDHLAPKDRAALLRILRGIVEKRDLQSVPID
jgi:hypothetical protein